MYLLDIPPVPYADPWASTYQEQIQQLSRKGFRVAYYYDQTNSSTFRYRTYNMIYTLNNSGLPFAAAYFTRDDLDNVDQVLKLADALVICRSKYTHKLDHLIMRAKNRGIPVLYDIDDLVFDLRAVHLVIDSLDQLRREEDWDAWFADIGRHSAALQLCDGAITTNAFLAKRLHDATGKPVHVVPNFLNEQQLTISDRIYQQKQERRFVRDGKLHLGYFSGTPSHNKDFRIMSDALIQLMRDYPQVVVRIAGHMDTKDALRAYQSRVETLEFTDFVNLQRNIGATEINLVPLQDNEFTNCKSQLKYFEAGIVGTVTVASPTFTYANSIEHGKNGYLANSYQWYEILADLIENIDSVQAVVETAREHSIQHFAWYNQIDRLSQVFLNGSQS